jgi:Spy/CpxP family protein refolding chaperone
MRSHEFWGPGKALDLTPEQRTKLEELRRNFRAENAQLIGAIVAKRLELQSLWANPKAESKAILDKEKELRDLRNQMKDKRVQLRLEARKFLTPEQLSEFGSGWGMDKGFCGGQKRGRGYRMGPGMGPWMEPGMGPGPGMRQ